MKKLLPAMVLALTLAFYFFCAPDDGSSKMTFCHGWMIPDEFFKVVE